MTLTILFDLDDTLLAYDQFDLFIADYLKGLAEYNPEFPPDRFTAQVISATTKMISNRDPSLTLEQVFDTHFYPALNVRKEDLKQQILSFYNEIYPKYKKHTAVIPEVKQIMDTTFNNRWEIVIATNPLFPRVATNQRIRWAGLPIDQYPFSLITTYESFHFSKPNPSYFAEILAQLGWPDQPAVMVGNDLKEDLIPAAKLGLPVYWVTDEEKSLPPDFPPGSQAGRLNQLIPWLEWASNQHFSVPAKTPQALLSVLSATPAALMTNYFGLEQSEWLTKGSPDTWSPVEIITHMRDVDREVNIPRIKMVCSEKDPFLPGIDTDPWAVSRDYIHQNGQANLLDLVNNRIHLVNLLYALPEENWHRSARHAIFGPTDLTELCSFIATHDQVHLRQLQEMSLPLKQFA